MIAAISQSQVPPFKTELDVPTPVLEVPWWCSASDIVSLCIYLSDYVFT